MDGWMDGYIRPMHVSYHSNHGERQPGQIIILRFPCFNTSRHGLGPWQALFVFFFVFWVWFVLYLVVVSCFILKVSLVKVWVEHDILSLFFPFVLWVLFCVFDSPVCCLACFLF